MQHVNTIFQFASGSIFIRSPVWILHYCPRPGKRYEFIPVSPSRAPFVPAIRYFMKETGFLYVHIILMAFLWKKKIRHDDSQKPLVAITLHGNAFAKISREFLNPLCVRRALLRKSDERYLCATRIILCLVISYQNLHDLSKLLYF
jgi:hypothetical protein